MAQAAARRAARRCDSEPTTGECSALLPALRPCPVGSAVPDCQSGVVRARAVWCAAHSLPLPRAGQDTCSGVRPHRQALCRWAVRRVVGQVDRTDATSAPSTSGAADWAAAAAGHACALHCDWLFTRLGSARLGSARLGSARLGSARLGSHFGHRISLVCSRARAAKERRSADRPAGPSRRTPCQPQNTASRRTSPKALP